MSKSTVKVVEIDTNPAVKSLKDLRKELMEYKNQMANLEEGSDAFLEVANKAGEVKHQIDEINLLLKALILVILVGMLPMLLLVLLVLFRRLLVDYKQWELKAKH